MELQNVRIYKNLSAKFKASGEHVLSIQTKTNKGWRVTHYYHLGSQSLVNKAGESVCDGNIVLNNFSTKISQAGLKRTRAKGVKQVHAFLCGDLTHNLTISPNKTVIAKAKVAYSVDRGEFFDLWSSEAITPAGHLVISTHGIIQTAEQ